MSDLKKWLLLLALLASGAFGLWGCNDGSSDPEPAMPTIDYGPTIQQTTALIQQTMRENQIVGLSIALVDGQNVVWEQGFGYADQTQNKAATASTLYQIGSISKLFTATAVMQLAEQGRIDIDRPLGSYLPGFAIQSRFPDASAATVTPRRIMTHHAGLPNDYVAHLMGFVFRPQVMNEFPDEMRQDWLCFPPDTVGSYSNAGVTLLGLLVEQVAQQDFIAYTDQRLFAPLGMRLSSFAPKPEMEPYLSKGYIEGQEIPTIYVNAAPAGSVYSSVAEMTRFMRAMLAEGRYNGQTLLQPATLRQMWTPQNLSVPLDLDLRIGLNWLLSYPALSYAGQVVGHSGGTVAFRSELTLLPAHQLGVIVLSNSPNDSVGVIAQEALKSALAAKTGLNPPPPPASSPPASLPPETLARYAGRYAGNDDLFVITVVDDHLAAQSSKGLSFILKPLANGGFAIDGLPGYNGTEAFFETVAGRNVVSLSQSGAKTLLLMTRIAPPAPRPAWRARVGFYVAEDYGPDYFQFLKQAQLSEQDGALILNLAGSDFYVLDTVSDTEAVIMGLGRNYGLTVRAEMEEDSERLIAVGVAFRKSAEPVPTLQPKSSPTLRARRLD